MPQSRSWRSLAWAIPATALLSSAAAVALVPGGWAKASVKDPGVVAAAEFAVAERLEQLRADAAGADLKLVKIVKAEQQVVAGMNYRLTLEVDAGAGPATVEAVVWARVWLEEKERYQLTEWKPSPAG